MKKFLIHTFFTPKFLGPLAAFTTGLVVAWAMSALPGAPAFVSVALDIVMDIAAGRVPDLEPEKVFTSAELTAFVGPLVAFGLSWLAQRAVAADANKALAIMKDNGKYDGPTDGWVGDVAIAGLSQLVDESQPTVY